MRSKVYRAHDRQRRHEKWAFKVIRWFAEHGWVSGFGLAGYGLAREGYTDYPRVTAEEFSVRSTGAGPG